MFDNSVFEKWLDTKSQELVTKIGNGEALTSEEMIILVLKAQSNHFHHLDQDIRSDMKQLSEKSSQDMKQLREDVSKDMKQLREDMDKRFEQVDKRFEQVDKRFDDMIRRMDRFMIWSLGLVVTSTFLIIKFLS